MTLVQMNNRSNARYEYFTAFIALPIIFVTKGAACSARLDQRKRVWLHQTPNGRNISKHSVNQVEARRYR
jgi:hypothetical protein